MANQNGTGPYSSARSDREVAAALEAERQADQDAQRAADGIGRRMVDRAVERAHEDGASAGVRGVEARVVVDRLLNAAADVAYYAHALRNVVDKTDAALARLAADGERTEAAWREALDERDTARAERDTARAERDAARAERDAAVAALQDAETPPETRGKAR